jgi:hypothetical protein
VAAPSSAKAQPRRRGTDFSLCSPAFSLPRAASCGFQGADLEFSLALSRPQSLNTFFSTARQSNIIFPGQQRMPQSEIIFSVQESPEGGYEARALGFSIFTQADSLEELTIMTRGAVSCHFDAADKPRVIRLHKN